jgi:hypothetical protein
MANQRKRKQAVPCLEHDGAVLTDNEGMIEHAMDFYKKMFGEEQSNIRIDEDFFGKMKKK